MITCKEKLLTPATLEGIIFLLLRKTLSAQEHEDHK